MIRTRNSWLSLLTIILAFNYVDRVALGILLQDIKIDLDLTDTQLGLLTGIAFALLYAVIGIPLARWADKGNRVSLISLTVGLWSAAVAACGAATSFLQIMLARIVVGVGEAGFEPAALSLLSDYFKRHERARAIARYKLGWPIAIIMGNFAAGWLNELVGWRLTFLFLGMPGILLAIVALTLSEPRRPRRGEFAEPSENLGFSAVHCAPSLGQVVSTLWKNATYRWLLLCFLFSTFFTVGIMQWQPAFYIRSHGFETGELGTLLAIFYGGGTLLGTYVGGELVHRFAATNERLQLRTLAILYAAFGVLQAGVYLVEDYKMSMALLALSVFGGGATNGPLFAATQTIVPSSMRAMSLATILFVSNLIGIGLGPLLVGIMSDCLHGQFGGGSLRIALIAMTPGYLWCTWCLWKANKTVLGDIAAAEVHERPLGVSS